MIRKIIISTIIAVAIMGETYASGQTEPRVLTESQIEDRAKEVGRALRCVVCQNQSIEESDASLAEDMRTLVRARIRDGSTNDEVIDYMQSRYGDFVLLEPPVQQNTYVLWAFPFVLLFLALIWFMRTARKKA